MSSPHPPAQVSLNARITAVATVLCDGQLHVINADPFAAILPPAFSGAATVQLHCFPFEAAETTIVEISAPIAFQVPSTALIDDWAVRQGRGLFNVYVVREDSGTDKFGSVLKAQSSIIATDLSVPVLGLAVEIIATTAPRLTNEFHERFGPSPEPTATIEPAGSQTVVTQEQQPHAGAFTEPSPARAMPGLYL